MINSVLDRLRLGLEEALIFIALGNSQDIFPFHYFLY